MEYDNTTTLLFVRRFGGESLNRTRPGSLSSASRRQSSSAAIVVDLKSRPVRIFRLLPMFNVKLSTLMNHSCESPKSSVKTVSRCSSPKPIYVRGFSTRRLFFVSMDLNSLNWSYFSNNVENLLLVATVVSALSVWEKEGAEPIIRSRRTDNTLFISFLVD